MQDFPFTIRDVASVMNLRIRHRNTVSLDVDCPLCDDHKGKMNLNFRRMYSVVTGAVRAEEC